MTNILYLNRDNRCEMEGTCVENGATFSRDDDQYPCFRAAFAFVSRYAGKTYDIKYKLHMNKRCDGHNNNFVVLPKVDLMRLLNSVQHVIPFKYHFTDKPNEYVLKMNLVGTPLQHKGLLMLSRMLFEYPHNLCAADALQIKKEGQLGDIKVNNLTLLNLYTLCLSSTPWYSLDESILHGQSPTLMPTKKFQKALKSKAVRKKISAIIPAKEYNSVSFTRWGGSLEDVNTEAKIKLRREVYTENLRRNRNA